MTFFTIAVRGLTYRPVRTGLTVVGIAIRIAAVVTLVGISRGFNQSWEAGMKARGTDVVLSNMASSLVPKPFSESVRDRIAHLPSVAATCSILVDLLSVENADIMMVSAREWEGFTWKNFTLVSGRMPHNSTEPVVLLGRTAADTLKKRIGDPIQIETRELHVVGIVDGNAWVENSSVILSLPLFQDITGNQGKINVIDLHVTPTATLEDVKRLCDKINELVPEGHAVAAGENIANSQAYRIMQAMSWSTSLLAVCVGVLGVMNTVLMNVFERTHEICVLLALGWKRGRIIHMVLLESALLGVLGGIAGVLLGALGGRILGATPAIRGLLEPDLSVSLLLTSLLIAVAVGVISGLYPAWRSSRLKPIVALNG